MPGRHISSALPRIAVSGGTIDAFGARPPVAGFVSTEFLAFNPQSFPDRHGPGATGVSGGRFVFAVMTA